MADYNFSLTTFNRAGKLGQIEHALRAIQKGATCLGIRATNGVVIATEKTLPSVLVDESSVEKLCVLSDRSGVGYSGMGTDFRVLVRKGQKVAETYRRTYCEDIPVLQLVRGVAQVVQEFTQSGGVRPFGVSLLVAGYDHEGPQLFQVDPSGTYFGWKASAIGKNFVEAKTFLEKRFVEDMELEDAIHTALLTLREGFEGEMTSSNIELAIATRDGFRVLSADEVADYLEETE